MSKKRKQGGAIGKSGPSEQVLIDDFYNIQEIPPLSEPEAMASMIRSAPPPEDDEAIFHYRDEFTETCRNTPNCAAKLVDEYLKHHKGG